MSKPSKQQDRKSQEVVRVALSRAGGVDVLGDGNAPLLRVGEVGEFTPAEAAELLKLTNRHGTPIVHRVNSG